MLVVDEAENPISHQKYVLLAQSIHMLHSIGVPGAWFAVPGPAEAEFNTSEWTFAREGLKRFE